jgi:predicted GIY-YIG superfamily endonuclease
MFFVYLLVRNPCGTLYIGSTSDLVRRVWKRAWKVQLIEQDNPYWIDLYPSISV